MRRVLPALMVLGWLGPARADEWRHRTQVVAASRDGRSALLQVRETSGGGGVRLAYRLLSVRPAADLRFRVRESAGLGRRRKEQISGDACGAVARRLTEALQTHRFSGVKVRAEECAAEGREILAVDAQQRRRARDAFFEPKDGRRRNRDRILEATRGGGWVVRTVGNAGTPQLARGERPTSTPWLVPGGRILLVFERSGTERHLEAVLRAKPTDRKMFEPFTP